MACCIYIGDITLDGTLRKEYGPAGVSLLFLSSKEHETLLGQRDLGR
jgi:hypothetical protein